jgi:hypothetical protein
MADGVDRVELTLRLWGTGDAQALDEYVEHLIGLLGRHRGAFERRVAEVDAGPGAADAVLVLSFPNGAAVDGFLRDPLRSEPEAEDLAARAVSRALVTDAHHHPEPDDEAADVVDIHGSEPSDR